MRILGIDPGTRTTGYGLLWAGTTVRADDWGIISFKGGMPLDQRIYQLYSEMLDIIRLHQPDELAIEAPFVGRGHNRFTASAFALGQAQASVVIAAVSQNVPVFHYSPAEVKLAVADYGRASKEQVQELVARQLGMVIPLSHSDSADALAIGLCHVRRKQADLVLARGDATWPMEAKP